MHTTPHTIETKRKMSLSKIKAGIRPPSRLGCIPWNKGKKGVQKSKFKGVPRPDFSGEKHPAYGKKYPERSGANHHNWKGDKVGYDALHDWIRRELGKAKICSNFSCKKKSKIYEWANVSGKYLRKYSDFIQLCRSCHRLFDYNNHVFKN